MSVTQYATLRGISRQAVLKRITGEQALPGVINTEKIGSTYILTIDDKWIKQQAKKK